MDKQWYDDNAFYVEQKKWGTWQSTDKESKGLVTSLSEEQCVTATRWYLKQKQEGEFDKSNEVTYSSVIEGKL